MPLFQITVVNHDFESTIEEDLSDLRAAKLTGLKSAIEIGGDQVLTGSTVFAAEVIVTDGTVRERFVLSIGVSALK